MRSEEEENVVQWKVICPIEKKQYTKIRLPERASLQLNRCTETGKHKARDALNASHSNSKASAVQGVLITILRYRPKHIWFSQSLPSLSRPAHVA